ncbi:MAG: Rne/Rng family ribonuclease [Deltaproteobacteria bacterium]|nr:Rne/Rng family ribonuclease [Deltaproteobacteria bacterium]
MRSDLILNVRPHETRLAILEDGNLVELHLERRLERSLVGNIYRGRILKVLPGMQAAFVDIGLEKAGFLYVSDVIPHLWENEFDLEIEPKGYYIEDMLQQGQEVLVQVMRDPIGTKGPRLSTRISIPGHYLVLMPFFDHIGVSRRIEDEIERKRLKGIVEEIKPKGLGFIIRTASVGVDADKLSFEMQKLIKFWEGILEKKDSVPAAGLVYKELDLCLRAVRDFFARHTRSVIIDSPKAYHRVLSYVKEFIPHLCHSIELYQGGVPIFEKFSIEEAFNKALQSKIWLKSGGYIIIEITEALVTIDVNTGHFVGGDNFEETILKTNLEAVQEIAHQLRLRDLGGIIIIDFIDMQKEQNRQKVIAALEEVLKRDRSKTQILQMSKLGLVEMTRKRKREDLIHYLCEPCPYCQGRGFLKSKRTIFYEILDELEKVASRTISSKLAVKVHPDLARHITEREFSVYELFEKEIGKKLEIISDPNLHLESYEILENF